MPNHVAPSHRRCRASVRIGSLRVSSEPRSIVVMTHRSHTIVARKGTSPMRAPAQVSSANGSPPGDDDVGAEAVVPERLPRLLAPLEGRLDASSR